MHLNLTAFRVVDWMIFLTESNTISTYILTIRCIPLKSPAPPCHAINIFPDPPLVGRDVPVATSASGSPSLDLRLKHELQRNSWRLTRLCLHEITFSFSFLISSPGDTIDHIP
ncbi:hypothetical protein AMECASPLE_006458 [Ameca splendens]|uniref:Uncharacterized protein n=1 Tax=Ameca splendens TaxID=208324 RepID=A0ABV0ZJ78_9TELE